MQKGTSSVARVCVNNVLVSGDSDWYIFATFFTSHLTPTLSSLFAADYWARRHFTEVSYIVTTARV